MQDFVPTIGGLFVSSTCMPIQLYNNYSYFKLYLTSLHCIIFVEGALTLESLLVYLRERVTFKWYRFGVSLGVPSNVLEKFVKDSEKYSEEKALIEVLKYWLKNHPTEPTWRDVASALRDII